MPYNNNNPYIGQILQSFGNVNNLMSQYQQWNQTFQGNPEQQIRNMLNNGQLSQQQFNIAAQLAQTIQNMYPNTFGI